MQAIRPSQRGDDSQSAEGDSKSNMELEEAKRASRATGRRHLGVRLVLTLVVLLPMLATGVLILSSANSAWTFRQNAEVVARDATALQVVASARAQMNSLEVPLSAVSYAAQIGISEPVLDTLLHPAVPFSHAACAGDGHDRRLPDVLLHADARADVTQLQAMIPEGGGQVHLVQRRPRPSSTRWPTDIDNIWYQDYNRLQADIAVVAAAGVLRGARLGAASDLRGLLGRWSRDRRRHLRPRRHRARRLQAGADPGVQVSTRPPPASSPAS